MEGGSGSGTGAPRGRTAGSRTDDGMSRGERRPGAPRRSRGMVGPPRGGRGTRCEGLAKATPVDMTLLVALLAMPVKTTVS